ncbi:reprolysin-like metallopeptidase [Capnocytophaga canis]|uniref:reprolysin-like metallopeptidase n=1 Tax=Capnocytophaga canis TaxID=1848903 RepID=UPI001F506C96|nr:gliding motility-associated C-terminal domain-containing protein [Capnocytophaga canis]
MKYYIYLIFSFISFGQVVFAQETIKTSTKAIDVIHLFSAGNKIEWAVPISKNEKILLQWEERHTSFTQSEGIRSFVGYHDKNLIAVISILDGTISGNIRWKEKEIVLKTSEEGFLILYTESSNHKCGTCANGHCHSEKPSTKRPVLLSGSNTSTPSIPNTNVLRVYRLAMAISYEYFSDTYVGFSSKVEEVKTFWATKEMELNEAYTRDLGIRFEIVKDENLISKQKDEISNKSASYIINNATRIINSKIGEKNYDLGIYIAKVTEVAGLAYLENAYKTEKAAAVALVSRPVIMHEIGHLFGARHTFAFTINRLIDPASDKTEILTGQSIMSYGNPRDFFSLRSIQMIREKLVNVPYFSDTNRTQKVGNNSLVTNFPYGIAIQNQPPTIDKTKIKASYKIPKETFFQFYIPAQDPENKPLLYAAHQTDIRRGAERSIASFLTRKATTNNPVVFQTEYSEKSRNVLHNTTPNAVGKFTFWLGVSDAQPQQTSDYISQYDMAQTQVIIEDGTPFKITSSMKNNYKGGDNVQLTWSVDEQIFNKNTSRVRILLSDDFGKTFKYTLAASTENDGNHTVKLPNVSVNTIAFGGQKPDVSAGVIKIEEIDGIAYALTTFDPKKGGFTITRDLSLPETLVFTKTPKTSLSATCDDIPNADDSQFKTSGCDLVNITHIDTEINGSCANTYTIKRVYTAKGCNQSVDFEQTIFVRDDKSPVFKEPLPTNVSVEEGKIPEQIHLTATDNCSANVEVIKSKEEKEENGNRVIIYKWEASDECGNKATHTQKITVIPSEINFVGELPKNLTATCEKEIPSVPTLQVSGNCNPKVVYNGQTKSNEKCKNDYVLTRSWTATNDCGKSITHTQVITIKDDVKPVFSGNLPTDISVEENNIPTQIDLTATDNCSENIQVTKSQEEKQENGNKVIIYKWEASDDCENKATYTQKVTIIPLEIQFIGELPKNLTISCEKEIPSVPTLEVSGNCNPKVVYNGETKSNEKCKNDYVLTRSWTATNDCGKSITHTQVITIKDDVKPVFSGNLPANISVEENKIPEQMDLTATDNCSENIQAVKIQEERQENGNKVIIYKWEASDDCGNKVTYAQKVTVVPSEINFVGELPKNLTISCEKEIPSVPTLQISGNCNPKVVYNGETKSNEKCKNDYVLTRSWTATNDCGKSITHTQVITIKDDVKPVFSGTLPADISVEENNIPTQIDLTATDNCSENIQVTKSQEEKQENGNKVIIYKWEASDDCENKVTHTQKIIVIPSEINFVGELPKNLTISCEKEIPSVPTLKVSGNCNPKVVYNGETKSNEKCKNDYVLTRSWTATNDCGKSITHTQVITIKDDVKPVFSGTLPADISVEENNIPTQIDLTATDNCSENIQVTKSQEEKEENGNKVIIYKWEASDDCGNKVTHEQKVTIKKSSQPTPPNGGSEIEKEMIVYNGVSIESGSENYLKFEPIENYKNLQIEIFNELGQKVYESKNYQKNGEVFRGYANVKGVFRKGKRLPTGTYFYVLKYQDITGESNIKQGYLFVR